MEKTTTRPKGYNTERKSNRRPPLKLSKLPPNLVTMVPGEPLTLACPDCGAWVALRRGSMIRPHRMTDRGYGERDDRCPGSGQRIDVDLTPAAWYVRLTERAADADTVRPVHLHTPRKPKRAAVPAVAQMSAPSAPVRDRLAEHQAECRRCQSSGLRCERATRLRRAVRTVTAAHS